MTPAEAARLLDRAPDATPAQLEARFLEIRARLEDKISKAPTPGLKEKYRASLVEITEAFETLTLAADGHSLPVLERAAASVERVVPNALSGTAAPASNSSPRVAKTPAKAKSNREFLIVTLIAVVVLGAGGWWVLMTRAESAERARQAEVAKAEAERIAAEKQRFELEDKAKQEAEFARLRAAQAELKIRWEVIEREANFAERRLAELRNDARGLDNKPASPEQAELLARLAAQSDYVEWLQPTLARHPARTLLARFDALLSTKALVEAAKAEVELVDTLGKSETELAEQRAAFLTLTSPVEFGSTPAGLKTTVVDGFGRSWDVVTPATIELPYGEISILTRGPSGWADKRRAVRLSRSQDLSLHETFGYGTLRIESEPAGLEFALDNGRGYTKRGKTPAIVDKVPDGEALVSVVRDGWAPLSQSVDVAATEERALNLVFTGGALEVKSNPEGAEVWMAGKKVGSTPITLRSVPTGKQAVELRLARYTTASFPVEIKPASSQRIYAKLEKRIRTEQEILNEFTAAAAGVWINKNKYGTGYVRITAGANRIESKSKGMFGQLSSSVLSVPDTKTESIHAEVAELQSRGWYSRWAFEEDSLIWTNNFMSADDQRRVFSRGAASDW